MPTFGLVGEGPTDHHVIKNILAAYFGLDVFARSVQPVPGTPGGWRRVFTWLEAGRHREALQLHDYLVLQLDTDVSNDYGVPHMDGAEKLQPEEIVERVVARLRSTIGPEFYTVHAARFLFAIAVHDIACWILALHDDHGRHTQKVKQCLITANNELARKRLPQLSKKGRGEQVAEPYRRASRDFAERERLHEACGRNRSLALFTDQLDVLVVMDR